MRRACLLVAAAALLSLSPASAVAAPLDVASGRAALTAYHAYMAVLTSKLRASEENANAFVAAIAARCPNVLSEVASLPSGSVSEAALSAFGQEIGFDVALAVSAPGAGPFAALSKALSRLRWSSAHMAAKVRSFVRAKRTLLMLPASNLCQDARALASSHAKSTPPGTRRFLSVTARAARSSGAGTVSFEGILARFSTPDESRLIKATNRLVRKLSEAYAALALSEGFKLLPVLGLSETA